MIFDLEKFQIVKTQTLLKDAMMSNCFNTLALLEHSKEVIFATNHGLYIAQFKKDELEFSPAKQLKKYKVMHIQQNDNFLYAAIGENNDDGVLVFDKKTKNSNSNMMLNRFT